MANPLVAPALAELAVITYRDVKNGSSTGNPIPHLPLPSQLVSVAVVYGLLGALPESTHKVGALVGWGFVVATLLNLFTPGGSVAQVNNAITASAQVPASQDPSQSAGSSGGGVGSDILGGLKWVFGKVA